MLTINYSYLKTIYTKTHSVFILLFMASCAQVVAPNGGKKDVKPPTAIIYNPDSAQLNFNSKTIQIEFDEYAQLKDVTTQLIISPLLEKTPEITIKNKTLLVTFDKDEKLKPNTTYSINFGNSIQDITENNAIDNFKYIFSTGNFIDSLTVKGKVQTAFNHKTEKGILVMLYATENDSAIYKNLPDYFAKTNAEGFFQITNVRSGTYTLVALKDINSNYKYDNEAEWVGFYAIPVDVSKKEGIKVELFQECPKKIVLNKYYHNSYGKVSLYFNQGSDSIKIKPLDPTIKSEQQLLEFSKHKDTLTYWIREYDKDSLKLQIANGNNIVDTLEIELIKKEKALKNNRNPLKLNLVESPNMNQIFDLNSELKLVFNNPIALIDNEPQLKIDTIDYKNKEKKLTYTYNNTIVTLNTRYEKTIRTTDPNTPDVIRGSYTKTFPFIDWKENTNYHLFIPPGTFTDIFGLTNDTLKIDFKTHELKYYGTLKLNLILPEIEGKYIVQLMDEKEIVIREQSISKTEMLFYEYLQPMKYKLKIIKDINVNEKWDTGNYFKKIPAEKVIYNPELIQIRSNWDAELEWKINK